MKCTGQFFQRHVLRSKTSLSGTKPGLSRDMPAAGYEFKGFSETFQQCNTIINLKFFFSSRATLKISAEFKIDLFGFNTSQPLSYYQEQHQKV